MKLHKLFIVILFSTNFVQSMKLSILSGRYAVPSIDPNDPEWIPKEYTLATTPSLTLPDASRVQVDVTFESCPAHQSSKRIYAQAVGTPEAIVNELIQINEISGIVSVHSVRATNYQSLLVQYNSFLGIIKSIAMLRLYQRDVPEKASIFKGFLLAREKRFQEEDLDERLERMKNVVTHSFAERDKVQALLIMLGKVNGRISLNESDRSWKIE